MNVEEEIAVYLREAGYCHKQKLFRHSVTDKEVIEFWSHPTANPIVVFVDKFGETTINHLHVAKVKRVKKVIQKARKK